VASSLRGIPATYFDVVFTIHQQQDHPPYLYYPIAPNKMTANRLTQSQAREHLGIQQAQQVISILIGASTKHVGIGTTEHWSMIIQKIKKQLPQAQLLITTSRRSSLQFEESLKTQLQKVLSARDQLICVVHGQNCDVKDFIQAADWVMVSADSTSMVAEVLMAEKKLLVAQLGKINDVRIREQLNDLEHQHWLKKINIEDDFNDINQYLNSINPLAHSKHLQIKLNQHLN
jgi:mitochondrial fission protein ELM1